MRLQHKAKVTSLSAQLEDLRKENLDEGSPAHSRKVRDHTHIHTCCDCVTPCRVKLNAVTVNAAGWK